MFNVITCSRNAKDLRIYIDNCDSHELRLTDGKLYDDNRQFVSIHFMPYHIFSSNNSMEVKIKSYPQNRKICELLFIVNDLTQKKAYKVNLSLIEQKLLIEEIE